MSSTTKRKKGIFYGWWVVLATSTLHFWVAGTFFYGLTAFFNPIAQHFRWSYAATSLAASFRSIEGGVAAPLVGLLTDRLGPRKLFLVGITLTGLGFIWFSRINSLWSFYLIYIFLSIGSSACLPIPGYTVVANWFVKRRGSALGLLATGSGAGGFLVLLITVLIAKYDWRTTLVILGIATWIIGIPLSLVLRHKPEQYGLLPDGDASTRGEAKVTTPNGAEGTSGNDSEFGTWEAVKTRSFWLVTLAMTCAWAAQNAVLVHVMPSLASVGISRGMAGSIAGFVGITSIAGRLVFGWLGDRVEKRYLFAISLLLQTVGLIFFAYTHNVWHAILFLIMFGPGYGGAITVRLAIQADYFGRKSFGSIQGVMMGIYTVGQIISPIFAGWVFDLRGSYCLAWLVLALVTALAAPVALAAKAPARKLS